MIVPRTPENEQERIKALHEYSILDTLPEKDFDDITKLASEICQLPIATVTLIDSKRQWFKSRQGLADSETPREFAFCAHAINYPQEITIVPDSRKDIRFADNPYVTGDPHVIFYAGVPLTNPQGHTLGTLCVIDTKPRELTEKQYTTLQVLANMIVKLLELRRKNIQLEQAHEKVRRTNRELEKFAAMVSHDIKSPLSNIMALTSIFKRDYAESIDHAGLDVINYIAKSADKLRSFIDDMLTYYKSDQNVTSEKQRIELHSFIKSVIDLVDGRKEVEFRYPSGPTHINVNRIVLEQILMNLLTNAIKYNDKTKAIVEISFHDDGEFYCFSVKDNGTGMEQRDLDKIFELFVNLDKKDRYDKKGSGIGLSTVKNLVETSRGKLHVSSVPHEGSNFSFTLKK